MRSERIPSRQLNHVCRHQVVSITDTISPELMTISIPNVFCISSTGYTCQLEVAQKYFRKYFLFFQEAKFRFCTTFLKEKKPIFARKRKRNIIALTLYHGNPHDKSAASTLIRPHKYINQSYTL